MSPLQNLRWFDNIYQGDKPPITGRDMMGIIPEVQYLG